MKTILRVKNDLEEWKWIYVWYIDQAEPLVNFSMVWFCQKTRDTAQGVWLGTMGWDDIFIYRPNWGRLCRANSTKPIFSELHSLSSFEKCNKHHFQILLQLVERVSFCQKKGKHSLSWVKVVDTTDCKRSHFCNMHFFVAVSRILEN